MSTYLKLVNRAKALFQKDGELADERLATVFNTLLAQDIRQDFLANEIEKQTQQWTEIKASGNERAKKISGVINILISCGKVNKNPTDEGALNVLDNLTNQEFRDMPLITKAPNLVMFHNDARVFCTEMKSSHGILKAHLLLSKNHTFIENQAAQIKALQTMNGEYAKEITKLNEQITALKQQISAHALTSSSSRHFKTKTVTTAADSRNDTTHAPGTSVLRDMAHR